MPATAPRHVIITTSRCRVAVGGPHKVTLLEQHALPINDQQTVVERDWQTQPISYWWETIPAAAAAAATAAGPTL